jgi:DNA-binding transcriptional ArsR family regulator
VSVHEIAHTLKITESSASKHLKLLYDLGLIDYLDKPPEKFYFLRIKEILEFFKAYDKVVKKMR